jgi:hypothetical protein
MSKRVRVGDAEFLTEQDFERFGTFPRDALDHLVGDAIGYPTGWAAVTVARKSAQEVTVSPGRFFEGDTVYEADAIQTLNLTVYFPIAASDEKFVALVLRGETVEIDEERSFETAADPEFSEPVASETPVIEHRRFSVVVQQGLAAPPPALLPEVAETDACIAFVRLTTQGVQEITPGERWRVKSLHEVEGRVTSLELSFEQIKARTETLETGMANANSAIDEMRRGMIRPEIFRQVRRDVAAIRHHVSVPEGARSDWYDPGLILEQWDIAHSSWLARIDEGIQFPFASIQEARLEVKNEDDPRIMFSGRRMVPAWDKVKRIANEGGRATRLISQLSHTEIVASQHSVSRSRTVYGPTVNACENMAEWNKYAPAMHAQQNFAKNGETFEVVGVAYNQGQGYHQVYNVRSVKQESYTETYWVYNPVTVGLNGSVYGQTFLVDQPLICPSIEIEFAKIGTDGAVHVLFCGTDGTGRPLIDNIIAKATLDHADLRVGWNVFEPDLTYFEPGKRYAFYIVTAGNHTIYGTDNNKFSSGTSFRFTDGVWAQGDLTFDFNFRVNGCRFRNSRTVVEFKSMTLAGGMTQFMLLYPNWTPEGTAISWEIQPVSGGAEYPWTTLDPAFEDNALVGLPSMVNLRCTLLTTPDLAPMIELSADAVYRSARVRDTFLAVSEAITLGLTTDSIETYTVLDDFDPAVHTFTPRIMVGNGPALIVPDTSTTVLDPDRSNRRAIVSRYTVPSGTGIVRNAPGGATTNVVNNYFIQNTALFAL